MSVKQKKERALTTLSHKTAIISLYYQWCRQTESNRQPIDYKSIALPIELCRQMLIYNNFFIIKNQAFLFNRVKNLFLETHQTLFYSEETLFRLLT